MKIEKNEVVRLIGLKEFLYIMAKKKWIMILITLTSVIIAFYVSYYIITPIYESQASVIVDKKGDNSSNNSVRFDDVMMYQNLIKTYENIGKSDKVYIEASKKLNNSISPSILSGSVSIISIENTQMLTIKSQGKSPKQTIDALRAVTDSFIEVSNNVYPAGDIKIVSDGQLPQYAIKPNKKLNVILGFIMGIVISIIIIFIVDYFDDTIRNREDLKRNFPFPVLGDINFETSEKLKKTLTLEYNPNSFQAEAYRILSMNIQSVNYNKDVKTILITSASKGEGKSIIASNLSLALEEYGNKVLLMDCNFRTPSVYKKFKVFPRKGLCDIIMDECKLEDAIYKYSDKFFILTTGELYESPSKLLYSEAMKNLIKKAENIFDFIIIDSTNILASSDAQILSKYAKGVLIVTASKQSEISKINKSMEMLQNVNAKIIGMAINKVKFNKRQLKKYDAYYFKGLSNKKISVTH